MYIVIIASMVSTNSLPYVDSLSFIDVCINDTVTKYVFYSYWYIILTVHQTSLA